MNENISPPPPPPPPSSPPPPVTPVAAAPAYVERKSPGLAGFLSIFPGLGHLYLGLYQRAFSFAGAFCVLIFLNSHHGRLAALSGPATAFVWFFAIIDAVRQAKAINRGVVAESGFAAERQLRKSSEGTGALTWGVILVGLGVLWILDRYVNIDWSFMEEWGGPAALILLGLILVISHVRRKRNEHASGVGMPPRSY